ncbi:TldD/PmbA family protein [Bacteroides helcogenes]|uniref:Peptidase U62 modulator of DNA gyrase n=1 Tax=Bacteroides helcogenes (strain ATCC 35417 / DSM 20613 / JCM 6297 / CCUG 15421 / P 36-108) TaxID=693979 RepID=E6SUV7_BACT6|nr:TldD/PmbA family protein [Bacteroides helcogenes]ADV42393.1 peptidase U62 modulator of DNA gyrase [Bacteroides helcogenes P 36-108]MDY5237151.1 TldD/PmbA family protein [Bacteroides helcogenes]
MITDENKKLAQWAMDYALKNGCRAAKLVLYTNSNSSFELRNGKIDRLQQATENGLGLSLYVDGRFGSFSTNRLDKKELETLITNGIESTRYLAEDESRILADPARYYKGGKPDLQLFDKELYDINPDDKVALATAAAEEVMGKDDRIVSVDTSYGDGEGSSYRLISNGFEGESKSTWFSVSASVSIKGEGEARPQDGWYDSALFYDKLAKTGIGAKALERVLRKLGQKKVKSGKYTMVVDPMNTGNLLSPMLNALYGSALQQKNSFLLDKQDAKVASELFTLRDEPHIVGAKGSRYFDSEGVATQPRAIFDKGVLKTYFIDTYNGKKMNTAPTISAPSHLILTPGSKDLNGLVADVKLGILVTGFNGGNSNSSTGDFSYGIEGFLIEDGKLTQPVNEMNVTGNMLSLWNSLVAVGNDPQNRSWQIPSLVFEGVNFSGL